MGRQRQGEWHVVSRTAVVLACALSLSTVVAGPPLADIGERLFVDRALSADGTVACASCHQPHRAFADSRSVSAGVGAKNGTRNAPSLLDVAHRSSLTWDGRTALLSDQVLVAFSHPREMALADAQALRAKVTADPAYAALTSIEDVRAALVAYLGTLTSNDSPYDQWTSGDATALSASAQRGHALFVGAAGCSQCHRVDPPRATFTDDRFHSVGVGIDAIAPDLAMLASRARALPRAALETTIAEDPQLAALGRFVVTGDPADIGRYRTPGLRNVAVTAPYFHDGSVATLAAAVAQEIYYRSQERGRPLALNTVDQADLVAFLESLTDPRWRASKGE